MGKGLMRIYKNCENGKFYGNDEVESLGNKEIFHETQYVYDTQTKFVYYMPEGSSNPIPRVSRGKKHYRFEGSRMIV